MSIYVGTSEIKNIYVGTTPVKEVYIGTKKIRPHIDTRTFTISWTEKSNMSSGWTYSDDAAGLTAGDTAFDEFFGYYGVRLSKAGVETNKVEQSTPGTLDITQLGTLTSGDDVMIAFPKMGYKMSKSGSTVTLSLTRDPDKASEGYKYYAFTKGSDIKDVVYLGAYEMNSSYRSLSGFSPKVDQTRAQFRSSVASVYNDSGRHSLMTYRVRDFIKMLYMMKYGNPDSQTVIGKGLTSGNTAGSTGATNSITSATGATSTSNTGRIKLFGLEDIWGNISEWMDCCYTSSSHLTVDNTNSIFQDSVYSTDLGTISSGFIAGINGSTEGTFKNISTSGGSTSAYYCDSSYMNANGALVAGGGYYTGNSAGMFFMYNYDPSSTITGIGSRLQFL